MGIRSAGVGMGRGKEELYVSGNIGNTVPRDSAETDCSCMGLLEKAWEY